MQCALPLAGSGLPPPPLRAPDRRLGPTVPRAVSTAGILRGTARLFEALEYRVLTELRLSSGRRVDVIGLDRRGRFAVAEAKSAVADWRADTKWPEYLPFCDRFYFAVGPGFPLALLPGAAGAIVADAHGGEVARRAPERRMTAAARTRQTLIFARAACARLRRAQEAAS